LSFGAALETPRVDEALKLSRAKRNDLVVGLEVSPACKPRGGSKINWRELDFVGIRILLKKVSVLTRET
jgi:hypothetical protein